MSNRLRELREGKGLTLKELVDDLRKVDLKISSDTLAKYERGEREPKLERWQKLADYFDVPIPYLQGLGVSRDVVINDLVDKIIAEHNQFSTQFSSVGYELQQKITRSDIEYLTHNLGVYLDNSSNTVDKLIKNRDLKALRYLVGKYIPLVNDYSFLASIPNNVNDYYSALSEKILKDKYNPFTDIFSVNTEIDNRDVKIFESICDLLVSNADTKATLLERSDDKKIEISNKFQELFELLTDDTDDQRVLEIRDNVKKLLDVYASDDYKLATDTDAQDKD
ncbi:helix-turn-helix transcriptional regulator [Ligilactobacillus murinus]|uniref:helix-turn-helix domain-containing protein n=1 Tax=Ligilactobacillus murinus TaxID=1622 RepID=UPI001C8BB3C3|nr:helix-turn-helix transcriptional regulator [Ligilactobacillus murinus]MBX9012771.1 helix-turn-helix transcriptional regulator [Ligilactobacillus murinus]